MKGWLYLTVNTLPVPPPILPTYTPNFYGTFKCEDQKLMKKKMVMMVVVVMISTY